MIRRFGTQLVTLAVAFSLLGAPMMPLVDRATPRAQAQAQFTIEAAGPLLTATIAAAGAEKITAGGTTIQTIIMETLEGLAWAAAKAVIQSMTRSIVNWINSGFEGSPAFVDDLNRSMRNLGDAVARDFLTRITTAGVIDSPFLENIALGVGAAYYLNSSQDRIARRLRYTLNEYSRNDRAFLDGDFRQGGFNAWFATWMNQSNNPIGANYIAGQELAAALEAQAFERLQELSYGRGFLSWKGECLLHDEAVSLDPAENCVKNEILTPGAVVERQLGITLESPLRQLELADSINEIASALMVQLVSQALSSTGLLGTTRSSSGGGGSFLDRATNPNQNNSASIGRGLSARMSSERGEVLKYQTNWQRIQTAAQSAQRALQSGGLCTEREEKQALVDEVLAKATNALSGAQEALAALDRLIAQGTSTSTETLNTVGTDYLALLSSGVLPDSSERAEAEANALDTGNAEPGSYYTQMMKIARECGT